MSEGAAVQVVQSFQSQLAHFVRTAVAALADEKVGYLEGLQLGTQSIQLGRFVLTALRDCDDQTKREILSVLDRGTWQVP